MDRVEIRLQAQIKPVPEMETSVSVDSSEWWSNNYFGYMRCGRERECLKCFLTHERTVNLSYQDTVQLHLMVSNIHSIGKNNYLLHVVMYIYI